MIDFCGKHVVVTGGAAGIGRGIVEGFASAGAHVVFGDYNGAAGKAAEEDIKAITGNGQIGFIEADLSDRKSLSQFAAAAQDRLGHADVLVNNVGVNFRSGTIMEHTESDFIQSYHSNIMSCVRCIQHFLPGMLQRRSGSVISISSTMALGAAGFSAYAWSKGSIETLTRTLALDHAADGIRFNAVAPGLIATPSTLPWINNQSNAAKQKGVPMGIVGAPEDIAHAVMFLSSDKASYITGQVLYVDGGLSVGE